MLNKYFYDILLIDSKYLFNSFTNSTSYFLPWFMFLNVLKAISLKNHNNDGFTFIKIERNKITKSGMKLLLQQQLGFVQMIKMYFYYETNNNHFQSFFVILLYYIVLLEDRFVVGFNEQIIWLIWKLFYFLHQQKAFSEL